MPRPVKLRLLSERLPEEMRETDQRPIAEAFALPPPALAEGSQEGREVLAILEKAHGKANEALQTAGTAVAHSLEAKNHATQALAAVTQDQERVTALDAKIGVIDQGMSRELMELRGIAESAVRQTSGLHVAALVMLLRRFALDRLPAMLAIAMNFILYLQILRDPSPLQLASVGMFGALVTAPAVWLSARKKET